MTLCTKTRELGRNSTHRTVPFCLREEAALFVEGAGQREWRRQVPLDGSGKHAKAFGQVQLPPFTLTLAASEGLGRANPRDELAITRLSKRPPWRNRAVSTSGPCLPPMPSPHYPLPPTSSPDLPKDPVLHILLVHEQPFQCPQPLWPQKGLLKVTDGVVTCSICSLVPGAALPWLGDTLDWAVAETE